MTIDEKNPNPIKDQIFMKDQSVLKSIVSTAGIQEYENIVEIGGGEGALTDHLASGNNYVTVIEIDPFYAAYLREKYKDYPNVTVIEGDALDYDFTQFDRIVANLPYTITEPFLMNLASSGALDYDPKNPKGSQVKSITLVLSQNSVRKMTAPIQITEGNSRHQNPEFGLMGAITKSFCDLSIVRAIPSEAFFPEPAVTSFVVNLTPKKEKTTVDRIVRAMLTDKKGVRPSVKRVYQTMLANGEIYKMNKHKGNSSVACSSNFTSKAIEDKSIYELSNGQISQLIQDLIKNDVSIKSRNAASGRNQRHDFRIGGVMNYDITDFINGTDEGMFASEEDDEEEEMEIPSQRSKFEQKYDYMYDSTRYNVLLNRGLEYLPNEELLNMLGEEGVPTSEAPAMLTMTCGK